MVQIIFSIYNQHRAIIRAISAIFIIHRFLSSKLALLFRLMLLIRSLWATFTTPTLIKESALDRAWSSLQIRVRIMDSGWAFRIQFSIIVFLLLLGLEAGASSQVNVLVGLDVELVLEGGVFMLDLAVFLPQDN